MSVTYSKKLSKIIETKLTAKLLPQVKRTAMWHYVASASASWYANNNADVIDLLALLSRERKLTGDFTVAVAEKSTRRCWVFVFDHDESSAIELVETKAVRGKVPHKIRVRMVADRLEKAEGHLINKKGVTFSRELLTKEGFKKALKACQTYRDDIPWFLQGVHEMMARDDMDKSVYDEAWDLVKVRKVMDT